MARIAEDEIERLKSEVSLVRLVESQGYQPKKQGKDYILSCPFHDEDTPSLVITPDKNLYHCFGCGAAGSVIDWTMKTQGVSFRHAVELLQDGNLSAMGSGKPGKRSTVKKLPSNLEHNAEDAKLLRQVIDYYHEALKQSPEALAYLEKRGITGEAIEQFKLGFANRTLGYRLPEKNRKDGAALRGQLQRIGILRSSGHEHFNGSLVIPVLDAQGNIVEAYGRKICDRLRKGTPKHLYLPGPHTGVWNAETLAFSPEVILCESLIDALTFWCAGYHNVTCSYGTEGFTADHLAAFKQHGIERVLIAYDRDEAGETAAKKLAEKLNGEGIDAYRLQFPKGMDANEYALNVQPAAKSLGVVIRSATWLGNGQGHKIVENDFEQPQAGPKGEVQEVLCNPVTTAQEDTGPVIDTETGKVLVMEDDAPSPSLVADPPEPLPAAAVPPVPQIDIPAEVTEHEIHIPLGNRRYRIRGLDRNSSLSALKINLLISTPGLDGMPIAHVDTLDLYSAKARGGYIKQAASELGLNEDAIKHDLGKVLLKCEALQEERFTASEPTNPTPSMSDTEHKAALELLQAPNLMGRVLADFHRCGVVGENANLQVGYLAAVSRKLDKPLAILIQSTSAAGKSALMEAVLDLMPEEERIQYSAMTGQSLYYLGETELKHKILAIAEEEGMAEAAYALKLLQSQGELTIASTGKDPVTGELKTREYRVEGPVMIFLTTTAIEIDEELKNRCLVLTVNESREQTQAIQQRQRFEETLEGLLAGEDRREVLILHRNAQRLLKPLKVVNPYADQLTFLDDRTRTRRDHRKYLALIRTITLLHQHQREVKQVAHNDKAVEYIEVTLSDIELANELAHEVLGRTLDELPPQTRRLLSLIHEMVMSRCKVGNMSQSDYRFSRREVREHTNWGNTQLKVHLQRLEELEYLIVHRGGRGQSIVYELTYGGEGNEGAPFMMGLIDIECLSHGYDEKKSGVIEEKSGSSRPQVGPKSGGGRVGKNGCKPSNSKVLKEPKANQSKNRSTKAKNNGASYRSGISELAPAMVAQGQE